jgi:pyridinium-3,5-bisthiocarboxylic acid mononucleotide nickel chelatase
MKIAYFDCFSGISGDMILGALVDAGLDVNYLEKELKKLNIDDYKIESKEVMKSNIRATKVDVITNKKDIHRDLEDINRIIDNSSLEAGIKSKSKLIFLNLAKAEAKIHKKDIKDVHFHEVGSLDSIIDIVGSVIGIDKLGIGKIYSSPLNLGSGFTKTEHGNIPVPSYAALELIKKIDIYTTNSGKELVTPTGAAILSTLSGGTMPKFTFTCAGYGAGSYDLETPNVLRLMIGEKSADQVLVIESNIDDLNPQVYDFLAERLFKVGVLDVYLTNILMKKNRPAIKITVLCMEGLKEKILDIIFQETSTFGVRTYVSDREILDREMINITTQFGKIRVKVGKRKNTIVTASPEYEDCKSLAINKGIPLKKVQAELNDVLKKMDIKGMENGS